MEGMQRRVGLVLAALGVVLLATATYGFGSIVADRAVDVQTTPDSGAYLGISGAENTPQVGPDSSTDVLTLTNNFQSDLTQVSVTISSVTADSVTAADLEADGPDTIDTGKQGAASLRCADDSNVQESDGVDVTLAIAASGESVSVDTTETVRVNVDCLEPTPTPTDTSTPTPTPTATPTSTPTTTP